MNSHRVRVAQSSPVRLRVRRTWRFKEIDLLPRREGTSRNGWRPTADALLTMERRRQPVAADGNRFGLLLGLAPQRFATGCHRLQPRGSIKAPSFVVDLDYLSMKRRLCV